MHRPREPGLYFEDLGLHIFLDDKKPVSMRIEIVYLFGLFSDENSASISGKSVLVSSIANLNIDISFYRY